MAYAIVKLGGKQHRVREGERLVVDRLPYDENATFEPEVLMIGGDGKTELAPRGVKVTARILEHGRGPKIRIGKYRPKNGYKKHTGFRAAVSQVVIESIGTGGGKSKAAAPAEEPKPKRAPAKPKAEAALAEPAVEAAVVEEAPAVEAEVAEQPKAKKAPAKPKAAAKPKAEPADEPVAEEQPKAAARRTTTKKNEE
jgi:large subunit ribosomal protein L21